MKDHHNYETCFIGSSDIASLTLRGPMRADVLDFGEDGRYRAYIVDEQATIPAHYKLKFETTAWLHVYDDDCLAYRAAADEIKVYRARERGCIIQLIGSRQ